MKSICSNFRLSLALAATLLVLSAAGCAPSVKVRSDVDPGVDMRGYQTYDFFSQLGVEGDSYSNLVGRHFRDAISAQMDARGYAQSDAPQLQVNVSIGAEEKVRVNTYQDPYLYGGFYGPHGYGYMGSPWGYPTATRTTVSQYTEANVYIDMVDASEHKLVWQGVATFTLTDKMQEQLRETVYTTVDKVFAQYPVAAPASK
ncbi:MAG TPA: DUF4136 domain-containing protein [Xanthomonadales bacterium]|nr:DUF4136 domain-containing protein [Xanthomonadales bacterium]